MCTWTCQVLKPMAHASFVLGIEAVPLGTWEVQVYIHMHIDTCVYMNNICERPHVFRENKSRLHGTVFWGPEVAPPGKRDKKRTSNAISTHDVPHFLFVQAWMRLNDICQNSDDHIEDS